MPRELAWAWAVMLGVFFFLISLVVVPHFFHVLIGAYGAGVYGGLIYAFIIEPLTRMNGGES